MLLEFCRHAQQRGPGRIQGRQGGQVRGPAIPSTDLSVVTGRGILSFKKGTEGEGRGLTALMWEEMFHLTPAMQLRQSQ